MSSGLFISSVVGLRYLADWKLSKQDSHEKEDQHSHIAVSMMNYLNCFKNAVVEISR